MPEIDFNTEDLKDWTMMVSKVRSHPLSQAGIINSEILNRINNSLENINFKLDELRKLDEILEHLKSSQRDLKKKGVVSKELDMAVSELESVSGGDKTALEMIKKHGPISTEELSQKLKLSRSTVSTRVNKLHMLGVLDKKVYGKEVHFSVKK